MNNLAIRILREKIISDLNEAELPIEVKRLVLKEIMSVVNDTADSEIAKEQELLIQSQKSECVKEEAKQDAEGVQQDNVGELSE